MLNFVLLHGYRDVSNCSLQSIIVKLSYHICNFENMGVVAPTPHSSMGVAAPRALLVKIFANHY